MKISVTIFVAFAALYSCQRPDPITDDDHTIAFDSLNLKGRVQSNDGVKVVNDGVQFNQNEPFEVSNLIMRSNYPSSEKDTTMCIGWTLTEDDVQKILKDVNPISGSDWHYLFGHLPCVATGEIKQQSETFKFAINAGSWLSIYQGDTTVMFGNFNEENEYLFLSGAWKEDEGND